MKVMVTGGAGYVGYSVCSRLAANPDVQRILVYDNFSRHNYGFLLADNGATFSKISVQRADVLDSRTLRLALKGIDCVCHLAAIAPSPFIDDRPHVFDQNNNWGTAELCLAMERAGTPRMVYLSSGAIYGTGKQLFSIQSKPAPNNAYGASKLAGEQHVQRLMDARDAVVVRSATVYGINPAARLDTFVNHFVVDCALQQPLSVHGSGEQHRPIIHVDEIACVVEAAVWQLQTGVYDAVQQNVMVGEIVTTLRSLVPELENVFLNQGQRLKDLKMLPDKRLQEWVPEHVDLSEKLQQMLASLSVGPGQEWRKN